MIIAAANETGLRAKGGGTEVARRMAGGDGATAADAHSARADGNAAEAFGVNAAKRSGCDGAMNAAGADTAIRLDVYAACGARCKGAAAGRRHFGALNAAGMNAAQWPDGDPASSPGLNRGTARSHVCAECRRSEHPAAKTTAADAPTAKISAAQACAAKAAEISASAKTSPSECKAAAARSEAARRCT